MVQFIRIAHLPHLAAALSATALLIGAVSAEKVLMYDEERGIIFVDKDKQDTKESGNTKKRTVTPTRAPVVRPRIPKSRSRSDIHVGRKKDPPELYFKSGLQYFKGGDYISALKNFTFAKTADPKPEYFLWMGKTYRQLEQYDKMLQVMEEIRTKHATSDVADDALFEIAFYHQKHGDYHMATEKYAELAEQYPFGVSFSNGEEFREVSRTQRQLMRAEMVSALKVLGIEGETPADVYSAFQKANGLNVTGTANRETVRAIKAAYNQKVADDTKRDKQNQQVRMATVWVGVGGVVLLLNLWAVFAIRARAAQRARQLETLQTVLSDLDTKSL